MMDGSSARRLQLWAEPAAVAPALGAARPRPPDDLDDLLDRETLRSPRVRRRPLPDEPFSLAWFQAVEQQRHGRHGSWIPKLLEFHKHSGETVLCLGDTLGTDWQLYARHGSQVIACAPAEHLPLVKQNFELRGLSARFQLLSDTALPLADATVDVICLHGLLADAAGPKPLIVELFRVLRPGGKVIALQPARRDVDYWLDLLRPWRRWFVRTPAEVPTGLTGKELRHLFDRFAEHRIYRRHLRRADLPHVIRWMPPTVVQRAVGRWIVLKAFKPIRAARPVTMAA